MEIIYAANARIPSEKAHPYQIVQMCEAFAGEGADVTLYYAARRNLPELHTDDIWGFYGVARNFTAERVPCLDLYVVAERLPGRLAQAWETFAEALVKVTYYAGLMARLARRPDAVIYSRNALTLAVLSILFPRRARRAVYEAHNFPASGGGKRLRGWLLGRISGLVTVTEHLRQRYLEIGAQPERAIVAHDGIRQARFDIPGTRSDWRHKLGWPEAAFIVGYMGRFYTLGMDKGMGELTGAAAALAGDATQRPLHLALVGGPAERVDAMRAEIEAQGGSPDTIIYPGQVPPADVPGYLRAFDVCVMPFPWTAHFAYYASPMKLFEYMASGAPIVATELPSTAEIVRDGHNGLLVLPSDVGALADALRRLRDDAALGERLAAQAAEDVLHYTWSARARRIMAFMTALD